MDDDDVSETAETPAPLAPDTALTWLAAARPAAVLALLRDPDSAPLAARAFAGFQVNPKGYANPLVRRRLAAEAVKDDKFADKLRVLADQTPPPAAPRPAPLSAAPDFAADLARERDERRREREAHRQEQNESRAAMAQMQAAKSAADDARTRAEAERDEARRQAETQARRLSRLERQAARWQAERREMLAGMKANPSPRPPPRNGEGEKTFSEPLPYREGSAKPGVGPPNPWLAAVHHLLDKGRNDAALNLAADVLRTTPDEPDALDIAARALEAKGERDAAAARRTQLLDIHLARGASADAADALRGLLAVAPTFESAEKPLRRLLARVRNDDVEMLRAMLTRLRAQSPDGFAWLAERLTALTPTLAETLMPPPGALGPDDTLPLTGVRVTARRLLAAVAANEVALVEAAREALAAACGTEGDDHARILAALERTAEGEATLLTPLTRAPRGPVVVDASNAAWFDQESLSAGRPRLRPLLELRRTLHRRGFFPVVLLADAPLPYTIDDAETLRGMLARGEIALVDSGVDADEVLLREARRLGAPLVTNDYMTDWDPMNEVEKIGYVIAPGGAHLLF